MSNVLFLNKYFLLIFKLHQLLARIYTRLLLSLADSLILPFNCVSYALEIQKQFYKSFKSDFAIKLEKENASLKLVEANINEFIRVSKAFHQRLSQIDGKRLHYLFILASLF